MARKGEELEEPRREEQEEKFYYFLHQRPFAKRDCKKKNWESS